MRIFDKFESIILSIIRWKMSPINYARFIGVTIGENCNIHTKCWSSEPYLITIGNNVHITQNVRFQTHGGSHVLRSKVPDFDSFGKIVVEDDVYIGAETQILPGVTIGKGSLIGAGSVVTKSIPTGIVVAGNPARFICTIDQYIERNLIYNIHSENLSAEDKKQLLIKLPDDKFLKKKFLNSEIRK